ncbi:type A chloramphenicol O-acetyltransferase [Microbacterium sp. P26]|uniref:type A chloramphenicol O-acetyltransferase n=1 Tax=Microbacterium TaxID=33882 RepID=UPI00203B0F48|nr:type A chloramphenicol O-acetyltransferase [Microbacterium sp. P26]MCM3501809.1 type A chloramphenicol O-acetyltransferase [Microbacterium sp. P26]
MDQLIPIDLETWPRRQHFEHYLRTSPCTYALTVEIDVTDFVAAVRASGRRTYIAQIWAISSIVNRRDEFRMRLDEVGAPAVWDRVHPVFTVFHRARETFACLWVPYLSDFAAFHESAEQTIAEYADSLDFFPQGEPPLNTFDVSSVPWTSFTGFTLNIESGSSHLSPIFTLGRYVERGDRVLMPLALQVHHAVADGFHAARLVNEVEELLSDGAWLTASR